MITKPHRYRGKNYLPGDEFESREHEAWVCSPVRNYGSRKQSKPKKAKTKT